MPKEKKRRVVCATPLRKGSQATETTPVAKARNRRGKNSLRSNSLPLHPAPDLAARLSGNGPLRPRTHLSQSKKSPAGRTSMTCRTGFFSFLRSAWELAPSAQRGKVKRGLVYTVWTAPHRYEGQQATVKGDRLNSRTSRLHKSVNRGQTTVFNA